MLPESKARRMSLSQEHLDAIRAAVDTALGQRPQASTAELAVAAAAAAAAMGQPAAADINAISHTIPNFWPEDVDGFFSTFEAACLNKGITQGGTKYSKLLSVLTPAARTRMVGHLPEPGTNQDDYQRLKGKLKEAYTMTVIERCAEMMSIASLGDRNPEHLLSYMRGLLPGEDKSKLFRYIWLNALPESVHEVLAADDGNLGALATEATKMMREKAARRKRASQINAVKESEVESPEGEISAVSRRKDTGSKTGSICANHLRFPGKYYRCFDPDNCLLKNSVIQRPSASCNAGKRSGNARAGRQ